MAHTTAHLKAELFTVVVTPELVSWPFFTFTSFRGSLSACSKFRQDNLVLNRSRSIQAFSLQGGSYKGKTLSLSSPRFGGKGGTPVKQRYPAFPCGYGFDWWIRRVYSDLESQGLIACEQPHHSLRK